MTLLICTYVPTGIVIAADSRTTLTLYKEQSETHIVLSDSCIKLFQVFNRYSVAHTGDAHIDSLPIEHHIKNFEYHYKNNQPKNVKQLTEALILFFKRFSPTPNLTLLVCGYTNNIPYVYVANVLTHEISRYNVADDDSLHYGVCYLGDNDIVRRLLSNNDYIPEFNFFNNQDAIDFSRHLIRATIDQLKFEPRFPTVGGAIDTMLLTPESCEFIVKKTITVLE